MDEHGEVVRNMSASQVATALGFTSRAVLHWADAGMWDPPCPHRAEKFGGKGVRQRLWFNLDEVKRWRVQQGWPERAEPERGTAAPGQLTIADAVPPPSTPAAVHPVHELPPDVLSTLDLVHATKAEFYRTLTALRRSEHGASSQQVQQIMLALGNLDRAERQQLEAIREDENRAGVYMKRNLVLPMLAELGKVFHASIDSLKLSLAPVVRQAMESCTGAPEAVERAVVVAVERETNTALQQVARQLELAASELEADGAAKDAA